MQGHISVFLPSLPFYLTFKSRDRTGTGSRLCPLYFTRWCHCAQSLHGPAPSPASGRCCCPWASSLTSWLSFAAFDGTQALRSGSSWKVGRTDIEDGFGRTLGKKKQTSKSLWFPVLPWPVKLLQMSQHHPWKQGTGTSLFFTPGCLSAMHTNHNIPTYSGAVSNPPRWDTRPPMHTFPIVPSYFPQYILLHPRHPLWFIHNWLSLCLSLSFPNNICGRGD